MQALMLAAGMGKRLGKLTNNQTKCMIQVGECTLIERAAHALKLAGITRFIIVVGYEAERLMTFATQTITGMELVFVYNKDYATTNNIYSFSLARDEFIKDDTILIESDLIFEESLINRLIKMPDKNVVAVAKYEQWMDGTVALLNAQGYIGGIVEKRDFEFAHVSQYFKTVNIYKFSRDFLMNQYIPFLDAYIQAYGKNQYYELVLKTLTQISDSSLKAFVLPAELNWYEIDDIQDLDIANTLFALPERQLSAYEKHYGGFWRFPKLKDFCYLVNPYFPPQKMQEKMQYFFSRLLQEYPSGMRIQQLLAEKMFHVTEEYILVGNGAAELINILGRILKGKAALAVPAFEEYVRCFPNCEIIPIESCKKNYCLQVEDYVRLSATVDALFIVNPDNPTGSFLTCEALMQILAACRLNHCVCVVDESFVDFADKDIRFTLLSDELLTKYPELIVIKSISKSYGVPGLRLGVLATTNETYLSQMRMLLPIWNINSFAEYFLQIFELFRSDYVNACDNIAEQRHFLMDGLQSISFLTPYLSQSNYIMCKVSDSISSKVLAEQLLNQFNILIKDLSGKAGFSGGSFVRIAVKDQVENEFLVQALETLDGVHYL